MTKYTKFATIFCGVLLLLWLLAETGMHNKRYWLDPLHFFDRSGTFPCIHLFHEFVILATVLAAAAGLFFDLRRIRKARTIGTAVYVICLLVLLWVTGSLLLWFTVGVAFLCSGG